MLPRGGSGDLEAFGDRIRLVPPQGCPLPETNKQLTGVDRLQVIKEALELHKDRLHLSEQQLLVLEQLEAGKNKQFPIVYCITPTYWRYVQKAELTRISQTLKLVPHVHWIVIEDGGEKSDLVRRVISDSKVVATHLVAQTAPQEKSKDKVSGALPPPLSLPLSLCE